MVSTNLMLYTLGLLCGLLAGAAGYAAYLRHHARQKRRLPAQLPLDARRLVTHDELEVWRWLQRAFYDHHVLVKVSVIRFTKPRTAGRSKHWHELLSAVYCSFTVCDKFGEVVGCVDVPGKRGLQKSHRDFKEKLLSECRIAYAVLWFNNLPSHAAVRNAFLGEAELSGSMRMPLNSLAEMGLAPAVIVDAKNSLHAKLEVHRQRRSTHIPPASPPPANARDWGKSTSNGVWEDSFLIPDDRSRPAELN